VVGSFTKGSFSDVAAQPTIFGWTVTGPLDHSVLQIQTSQDNLQQDLSFLWELDCTPEHTSLSTDDKEVQQHFGGTHSRDVDGRYIVKLPRINKPPSLGSSRNLAMRRCIQNNKTLIRKGKAAEFDAALSEYMRLRHAEDAPILETSITQYYMPVHAVYKILSTTTKVRPVFDASVPTNS